jgi:hypothetical protein
MLLVNTYETPATYMSIYAACSLAFAYEREREKKNEGEGSIPVIFMIR